VDENIKRLYEKRCSVPGGCDGHKFIDEDPWCKTADLGKPGHNFYWLIFLIALSFLRLLY
jgi:hypothetical protein